MFETIFDRVSEEIFGEIPQKSFTAQIIEGISVLKQFSKDLFKFHNLGNISKEILL